MAAGTGIRIHLCTGLSMFHILAAQVSTIDGSWYRDQDPSMYWIEYVSHIGSNRSVQLMAAGTGIRIHLCTGLSMFHILAAQVSTIDGSWYRDQDPSMYWIEFVSHIGSTGQYN